MNPRHVFVVFLGVLLAVSAGCDDTPAAPTDAEPLGVDARPALGAQIDRVGRPGISTALVATFNRPDSAARRDTRDRYNQAGPSDWPTFADDLTASLGILDALNGVCGDQLLAADTGVDRYAALRGVLLDDRLYVNTASGTCGVYLGLEGEVVGALPSGAGGCGGRTPNDDIIERSYSVLAAGTLTGVDDGIREDARDHSLTEFPFLAEPN